MQLPVGESGDALRVKNAGLRGAESDTLFRRRRWFLVLLGRRGEINEIILIEVKGSCSYTGLDC